MRRLRLCLGAAFLFATFCAPASAATPDELAHAKAYVETLYRTVPSGLDYRKVRWTPELRNLIARDDAAAGPGNEGVIGAEPLCSCQDTWPGYRIARSSVRGLTPDRAIVTVLIHDSRADRRFSVGLLLIGARWFVSDVHTPDQPSFLAYMRREVPAEERRARRR